MPERGLTLRVLLTHPATPAIAVITAAGAAIVLLVAVQPEWLGAALGAVALAVHTVITSLIPQRPAYRRNRTTTQVAHGQVWASSGPTGLDRTQHIPVYRPGRAAVGGEHRHHDRLEA